jgi:hypothetical protein
MVPVQTWKDKTMTTTEQTTEQQSPNSPRKRIRVGGVTATIWEQESEKGVFFNVTIERRYRDANGNWMSSRSFGTGELLEVVKAADLAHSFILEVYAARDAQ